MERLKRSENGRYFVTEDKTPFSWLADTVWTLPQRMKWDDIEYYMDTRKSQGFTVLQIVALDPERDEEMRNPAGEKALLNDCLDTPNERYFAYLDWVVDKAEEKGFYILLLPAWGQLVTGDDWGGGTHPQLITADNAYAYGKWIGNRYRQKKHILWCLGGDRQPVHKGIDYRNVWRRMAEGLLKGVTGKDAGYNEPSEAWKQLLITYHTCYEQETGECSTFSYWPEDEAWISFSMIQSGHGLHTKNYEIIEKEYSRKQVRPVWDGEPAYEEMPTSWPPVSDSFQDSWMVRRRAYWSLFAGAFGYTYGHADVWCTISEKEKNSIAKHTWFQAIHSEGSRQMRFVNAVMKDLRITECIPAQNLLITGNETDDVKRHIQVCMHPDEPFICAYLASGGSVSLNLKQLDPPILPETVYLWWFNPRDGKFFTENGAAPSAKEVTVTDGILSENAPSSGEKEDWILIVKTEDSGQPVHPEGEELEMQEEVKKVFNW